MSCHPISAHNDGRLPIAANPQSFRDIWPSGIPAKMPHAMVKGHAKAYDLSPVHQWRSVLNLHTNAKSRETIFSCG